MKSFTHLNIHSHYSILESTATIDDIVSQAVEDGQSSIALTDSGNMFGALEFYKQCIYNNADIKPILGMRAYIAPESRLDKSRSSGKKNFYQILLLAKNNLGYKNLMKLSTIGYFEGFYYKPRIDKEVLAEYSEGIIALSAGFGGEIGSALLNNDTITAEESARFYKETFGDDFYIELHNHKLPTTEELLKSSVELARKLDIKLVATNNVHYVHNDYSKSSKKGEPDINLNYDRFDHAVGQNVLMYIQNANSSNTGSFDIENLKFGSDEYYLKTQDEMTELFSEYPEAIDNTQKIADECNVKLDLDTNHMPNFPIPDSSEASTLTEYLRELVYEGLDDRFDGEPIPVDYKERVDYEINVIDTMGYPGYFLIVWDFIKAARDRGVSVGPGRGSAAGSLVAYALEITNVDPLKYDLLFERFLNPDRVSMPDVDIDFNDEKRDVVIDYVKQKYGEEAVAQIITFGKLTSKAALTDVGRVLGVELAKIKDITKKIPTVFGKVHTIKMSLELPELGWLKDIIERGNSGGKKSLLNDDEKKFFDLIKYSLIVENKVRNTGIHAAGVVIAPSDLKNYVPLYKASKEKESSIDIATQFAMNDLEDGGLLKMDFLGLKTLSIIDKTIEFMKANHEKSVDGQEWDNFDIEKIPLDDQKTYDLFGDGNTLSVFQFESTGMQDYLKKLKPNNLEEITAMNALYRPGPMENIPDFIDRKFGRSKIKYLHPAMEESLHTTYGIIVYQEQVMKLVQDIAGFSLGQADLLRRAMGKKKIKEMDKMKPIFDAGAKKLHNINSELADEIFELIMKFANYGFNKSHSLAYSYLAYQTGWLKAHYPGEFIAANMTAEMNDQDKIVMLKDEVKKFGLKLLPPNINRSNADFTVRKNVIYFGLAAIRNVGKPAVEVIEKARSEKPISSFYDFVARVDTRLINKRTIEALICSGALDPISKGFHRNQLMHSIDMAIDYARSKEEQSKMKIDSLFGGGDGESDEPKLAKAPEWSETKRLSLEKEYLNFYVSGHPLFKYEPHVVSLTNFTTKSRVEPSDTQGKNKYSKRNDKNDNLLCGLVGSIRTRLDRNDNPIAFVEIEDFEGKCELIFWSESYKSFNHLIKEDDIIFAEGRVTRDDDNAMMKMTVNKVYEMDEVISEFSTGFKVWIDLNDPESESKLNKLDEILLESPRDDIYFAYHVFDKIKDYKTVYLSKSKVLPKNNESIQKLIDIFGYNKVRFLNYKEE